MGSAAGPSDPSIRYRSNSSFAEDEGYDPYNMQHEEMMITSKGNVSASFRVPGLVTIPSGGRGAVYNVTIAQLTLPAQMSWVSVPKVDFGRVHLEVSFTSFSLL